MPEGMQPGSGLGPAQGAARLAIRKAFDLMAARITEQCEYTGKVIAYKPTRAQRKAANAPLIPLTPAPKTATQRLWRALVG